MTNIVMEMRRKSPGEELDYTFIMDCLRYYKSPRAKVTALLLKGDLIRIKKGLYLFGNDYRRAPYSPEIIANKVYGPSYISREYALAYYGLIPEHVAEITSVSTKRNRTFNTPIGRFSYSHLPEKLYKIGFNLVSVRENATALVATAEKALADLLYFRKTHLENLSELSEMLFDDLRLDEDLIKRMKVSRFRDILAAGGSPTLKLLIKWIGEQK